MLASGMNRTILPLPRTVAAAWSNDSMSRSVITNVSRATLAAFCMARNGSRR